MTPGGGEGKGSTEKGGEEIKERGTKAFRLPSLGLVPLSIEDFDPCLLLQHTRTQLRY